jgi:hypothetical protein
MTCSPCQRSFPTWRSFKKHMMEKHRVSGANLARRAAALGDYHELVAIQSQQGYWFLFGQGKLL